MATFSTRHYAGLSALTPRAGHPAVNATLGARTPRAVVRSYLKNASDSRWRRCTPLKNAHNLSRLLRFFIGVRLALSCDLLFLRWLL
jgi:hypothetical protein